MVENACTISFLKDIHPPSSFAHYFEAKVGRGHLLKYLISLERTPLVPHDVMHEVGNHDDCCRFQEGALLNAYYRISVVPYKAKRHQTTCIVSGYRGRPCVSLYCEQ